MPNLYHTINSDFFFTILLSFWMLIIFNDKTSYTFWLAVSHLQSIHFIHPFAKKTIFVSDSCFISIQICSQWNQGHVQLHITRFLLRKNKDICQSSGCGRNMFLRIQMASQGDLPAEPSGMTMTCWETDSQCYQHQIQDATRTWTRSCSSWK